MSNIVYAGGSKELTVAASSKLAVASSAPVKIYQRLNFVNFPPDWSLLYTTVAGEQYVTSTFTNATDVRIEAGLAVANYATGTAPVAISNPGFVQGGNQGAPAAKTVSATLTAAEVQSGIITVNQAAAGASAQQLPLASAMDTAFPDFVAGNSFDFSVINLSTVDAEDASVTTNTGWTLVGSMDIPAYSAAGSLNSSGRFRARKTGTATWVLYRIS